jgi:hypothetical protein
VREELQRLRFEVEGWENHFYDFVNQAKKTPPETSAAAITAMWVMAKDSLSAFKSLREKIDELIAKGNERWSK